MKYIIDIENHDDDKFDINADNVGTVAVYDKNGENISTLSTVQLFLSRNGLLGLGTELIRLAHTYHNLKHFHLEASEIDNCVQRLGVFLTPDSAEFTVLCEDSEPIDDYFKENNKN